MVIGLACNALWHGCDVIFEYQWCNFNLKEKYLIIEIFRRKIWYGIDFLRSWRWAKQEHRSEATLFACFKLVWSKKMHVFVVDFCMISSFVQFQWIHFNIMLPTTEYQLYSFAVMLFISFAILITFYYFFVHLLLLNLVLLIFIFLKEGNYRAS